MKFAIFGLGASVDIRSLPGAWVAELLGVVLGYIQDHKKIKFTLRVYSTLAAKGLTQLLNNKNMRSCTLVLRI